MKKISEILVYSSAHCGYCDRAKSLLDSLGLSYQEIRVDLDPKRREEMVALTGRRTVPQIIIDGKPIGGFDDLWALHRAGNLNH